MAEGIWSEPALSTLNNSRNTLPLKTCSLPNNSFKTSSKESNASANFPSLGVFLLILNTSILVNSWLILAVFFTKLKVCIFSSAELTVELKTSQDALEVLDRDQFTLMNDPTALRLRREKLSL